MAPLPRADDASGPQDLRGSERRRMVQRDLEARGILDRNVLAAMRDTPRHGFVAAGLEADAYADSPLPTLEGQTMSQPYIVALMTEALRVAPGVRVLEIGTGSGYQTAVLSALGARVWTVESRRSLHVDATRRLRNFRVPDVDLRLGDGTLGWPEAAPFDRILATGSLPQVSERLLAQLAPGGIFVGPIGSFTLQRLVRITLDPPARREETLCHCTFVPLVGAGGWASEREQEMCHEMDRPA